MIFLFLAPVWWMMTKGCSCHQKLRQTLLGFCLCFDWEKKKTRAKQQCGIGLIIAASHNTADNVEEVIWLEWMTKQEEEEEKRFKRAQQQKVAGRKEWRRQECEQHTIGRATPWITGGSSIHQDSIHHLSYAMQHSSHTTAKQERHFYPHFWFHCERAERCRWDEVYPMLFG